MTDLSNLKKKQNQMRFKLTLIKLLSDSNTVLQQVSVYPTEFDITTIS